jgi:Mannosyltransferase (PIG-V)
VDSAPARSLASAPPHCALRALPDPRSDGAPAAGAHPWLRLPRGTGYAVGLAVAMRLALSSMAAWLLSFRPPHATALIRAQYLGQAPLHDRLLGPWQRFDAFWYLHLAMHGYGPHDGSTVYYPVYPLLIKLLAWPLGGNAMLAALVVSNVCFAGLLIAVHGLVAARHGEAAARRTLLLLCVFPTASFLLGAYTESLFLLLVVACFLAMERGRMGLAGALAFLAALTRLQGIVLALPLLWVALQDWRAGRHQMRPWLAAAMPPLGSLLFMAYVRIALHGGSVTDVYAQQVHQQLSPPWSTLGSYWTALQAHHWYLFSYPTGNWVDAMNLALALGILALAVPARRVLGTPLWLYALATWGVTLCIHQSTARYMLTVFPALITLAVWAPGRWTVRLALLLGAPLMLFVAGEFVLWSFVG